MTSDLSIWHTMCRVHFFEEQCHQALVDGRVKCFTYLSSGQEAIAAAVAEAVKDIKVNVFCQHRNHDKFIAFGGDVEKLRDELLGLPTGTTGGIGGDPAHHFKTDKVWMVGHDGLVASQIPIAVGMAFASHQPSICFLGDSSVEEETFAPSIGFAVTHKLPVLFVEEDNGLSVITEKSKRRAWSSGEVAVGYGCNTIDLPDEPFSLYNTIADIAEGDDKEPWYFHITTCRKYRHVGAGNDGPMAWDRMAMVREAMIERYGMGAQKLEAQAKKEMEELWA